MPTHYKVIYIKDGKMTKSEPILSSEETVMFIESLDTTYDQVLVLGYYAQGYCEEDIVDLIETVVEQEEANPYILNGEELERAEQAAKRK